MIGWFTIFSSSHEILVGLHRHNFHSLPPPTFARACAYVEEYGLLARLECVCVPACVFLCASFWVGVRASVVFAFVYPRM